MKTSFELSGGQVKALLLVIGVFILGVGGFGWVSESTPAAAVGLLLTVIGIAAAMAYTIGRMKRAVSVSLDEGGIRVASRSSGKSYVPFDEIQQASLRRELGRDVLHVVAASGPRNYWLLDAPAADLERQLQDAVARVRARAPSPRSAGFVALAKDAQPLDAWLRRVREMATADYRDQPIDPEALLAVVEDRAAQVELRAAAAHMLVWLRDHEKATRVMAVLGRTTPPLVVVAATLATLQGTYVAEYEGALGHLSPTDRAIAQRMIDERPRNLRVSAAEAGAEAADERLDVSATPDALARTRG